jgi:hypothetical protein
MGSSASKVSGEKKLATTMTDDAKLTELIGEFKESRIRQIETTSYQDGGEATNGAWYRCNKLVGDMAELVNKPEYSGIMKGWNVGQIHVCVLKEAHEEFNARKAENLKKWRAAMDKLPSEEAVRYIKNHRKNSGHMREFVYELAVKAKQKADRREYLAECGVITLWY